MKIVAISDTHSYHRRIDMPKGDVLVCAGDFTWQGELEIIEDFSNWLKSLSYSHILVIAGNHELSFQSPYRNMMVNLLLEAGVIYLEDNGVEINNLFFYGAPWQPTYSNWAFNLPRDGQELKAKWDQIPDYTNVLITHGPPYGILDGVENSSLGPQGCKLLKKRIKELPNLQAHIFGHLHHDGGKKVTLHGTQFVNAAICDDLYDTSRAPIVIEVE